MTFDNIEVYYITFRCFGCELCHYNQIGWTLQTNRKPKKTVKTFTRGGRTAVCTEVDDRLFHVELSPDTPYEVMKKLASMVKEKHSAIGRARPRKGKGLIVVSLKRKCSLKSHSGLLESAGVNMLTYLNGLVPLQVPDSASRQNDEAPQRLINQPQTVATVI